MESALSRVTSHGRRRDHDAEIRAAQAAVRLARWLAVPEESPATLAGAATRMLRSWGWADRCLAILDRASTSRVPRLGEVYGDIWARARARRAALDEAFARKLASWTQAGSASDLVCVENLLERIARPVAAKRAPLIVVLDGMSVAAGSDLTEEITARGTWLEAGRRDDGREPGLATVPSVTAISRMSLLTGALRNGGQDQERSGFAAFWGRTKSALFHKGNLAPSPGMPLSDTVRDAILATDTVVAVVLNALDDTLDKGPAVTRWTVDDVKYLGPVLDGGASRGPPGHPDRRPRPRTRPRHASKSRPVGLRPVQARGTRPGRDYSARPARPDGRRQARRRGHRGRRRDHPLHPRKAGDHGGAAPAEVVIPVITLFPSQSLRARRLVHVRPGGHAPTWWTAPLVRRAPNRPRRSRTSQGRPHGADEGPSPE